MNYMGDDKKNNDNKSGLVSGMSTGMIIGVVLGIAMDNLAIGIGVKE